MSTDLDAMMNEGNEVSIYSLLPNVIRESRDEFTLFFLSVVVDVIDNGDENNDELIELDINTDQFTGIDTDEGTSLC